MPKNLDIQGHRGARGLLPENTIPSFVKAIELGANTVELDVVVTKDKLVLVSHEPWLSHEICSDRDGNPITKENEKNYNLYEMTYAEIKQFDCGLRAHSRFPEQQAQAAFKPSLFDTIKALDEYCEKHNLPAIFYNIEVKREPQQDGIFHPPVEEFTQLVIETIRKTGIEQRSTFQAFDLECLQIARLLLPDLTLALLVDNNDGPAKNLERLGFVPQKYGPDFKYVDAELINYAKENNFLVVPWTVNELTDMQRLIELGVDGIITDYPNRLVQLWNRLNEY